MIHSFNPTILAAFAAIYLIWGSTYLAIKLAIATVPPLTMMGVRCIVAGGMLYCWARWRGARPPSGSQWAVAMVVGTALFLCGHGGLAWAQQRVPSGISSLLFATLPLWMVLIQSSTAEHGRISGRTFGGVAAGLLGIVVLAGPVDVFSGTPVRPLDACVLISAAISWAIGSEIVRRSRRPSNLLLANGCYLLAGGALLLMAGAFVGELARLQAGTVSFASLAALCYLTLFGTILAFVAYTWLLERTSLSAVSTYAFVNPIVAVLLGWGFGREALDYRVLCATALVVTAVVLILSARSDAWALSGEHGVGLFYRNRCPHEGHIVAERGP